MELGYVSYYAVEIPAKVAVDATNSVPPILRLPQGASPGARPPHAAMYPTSHFNRLFIQHALQNDEHA